MIHQRDIIADLHTHTTASTHAFSTAKENIDKAREKGLKYLAITDHFYGLTDFIQSKSELYRLCAAENYLNIYDDICIIGGVELNFFQKHEHVPLLKDVRWRLGGAHTWFFHPPSTSSNKLLAEIMLLIDNKTITAVSHIEREISELRDIQQHDSNRKICESFFKELMVRCIKRNVPIELNEGSLVSHKNEQRKLAELWLSIAKENKNIIFLGSDAHFSPAVGKFDECIQLLNEVNYPTELILNCNEDLLRKQLKLDT